MTSIASLFQLLDTHMTRPRPDFPQKPAFWPSEASVVVTSPDGTKKIEGCCARKAYLRYVISCAKNLPEFKAFANIVPAAPNAYSEYIFMLGKAIEKALIRQFQEMGIWVANNIKYYDAEHHISGEVDCILFDPNTEDEYISEIKTIYGYNATKEICGNKGQSGFPRISNLLQLSLYLDFLRPYYKRGKLLYVARDSGDRAEYDVTVDNQKTIYVDGAKIKNFTLHDVYARYLALQEHLQTATLPPNDFCYAYSNEVIEKKIETGELSKKKMDDWTKRKKRPGDWECGRTYCPFSTYCWPEERT